MLYQSNTKTTQKPPGQQYLRALPYAWNTSTTTCTVTGLHASLSSWPQRYTRSCLFSPSTHVRRHRFLSILWRSARCSKSHRYVGNETCILNSIDQLGCLHLASPASCCPHVGAHFNGQRCNGAPRYEPRKDLSRLARRVRPGLFQHSNVETDLRISAPLSMLTKLVQRWFKPYLMFL
jgi:hypothetical protein